MFHLIKQRKDCFPGVSITLFDLWPHGCVYHMSSAVQIRLTQLHQLLSSKGPRSALHAHLVSLTALGFVPSRLYDHTDSDSSLITPSVTPLFSYRLFIRWPKMKCISWPKNLSLVFISSKTFFPDQYHHAETDFGSNFLKSAYPWLRGSFCSDTGILLVIILLIDIGQHGSSSFLISVICVFLKIWLNDQDKWSWNLITIPTVLNYIYTYI